MLTCQCNGLEGPSNHACLVNIAVQITQIHTHMPGQYSTILLFSKHSSTDGTRPHTRPLTVQYNIIV